MEHGLVAQSALGGPVSTNGDDAAATAAEAERWRGVNRR